MKFLTKFYEDKKVYLANPCDVDAQKHVAVVGRALAYFGSHCPCCSGVRVLAAVGLTLLFQEAMAWIMGGLFAYALLYAHLNPPDEKP